MCIMKKYKGLIIILLFFSIQAHSEKGVNYFKHIFGHIHQNSSPYSSSLMTIHCGHPVKILHPPSKGMSEKWEHIQVGSFKGYVLKKFLSKKKTSCFQEKYPRFFEGFSLSMTEMYYWGRLYDQYIQGRSRVRK